MHRVGVGLQRVLVSVFLALSATLGGCSTVIIDTPAPNATFAEREALKNAATAVSDTPWPQPSSTSFAARMIGFVGDKSEKRFSKQDAIDAYVVSLTSGQDPKSILVADAETQLRAADRLTQAAMNASEAIRPSMKDVAIAESAIGSLREARDIYLASLSRLDVSAEDAKETGRFIKSDFQRAIQEIGDAADILADRVAADRTKTLAEPTNQFYNNFNGSL